MKKVLLCSSLGNPHVVNQFRVICETLPNAEVDLLSLSYIKDKDLKSVSQYIKGVYTIGEPKGSNPIINRIVQVWAIVMMNFKINNQYDCILINAITPKYAPLFRTLRKHSRTLAISPWGSEVLRAGKKSLTLLKRFYKSADWITTVNHSRFESRLIELLDVDSNKFVNIPYGSKLIDMHISSQVTKEEAKKKMNLADSYIITCGYNGFATQNHLAVLSEINKIKELLPKNTHIILPMTYGLTEDYKKEVVRTLVELGFRFSIKTDFMSDEELYLLQRSTDIFIHLQKTDASSNSVKEYIMAGATVFNGSWLSYPEVELHGTPYIPVDDYEDLGAKISAYLRGDISLAITEDMFEGIKNFAYSNYVKNLSNAVLCWVS